jgi:cysteine sulfinate desulfinase/cysteine desulfurase-like protein
MIAGTVMGVPREAAFGALRLCLGKWSTEKELDRASKIISKRVAGLL